MLTLSIVLQLPILKSSNLIAGNSTDNIINSISVLEVPRATEFIMPNELLITSFYSISNNVKQQVSLVKKLKSKNVSGLIICHTGIILQNISDELIEVCNKIDFPLIIASPNVSYFDIINPIMDILLEKKNFILKNSLDLQNQFINLVTKIKSNDSILDLLSKMINKNVLYFDCNLNLSYQSAKVINFNLVDNLKLKLDSLIDELILNKEVIFKSGSSWYAKAVINDSNIYGFLIIEYIEEFTEIDTVAISQAINSIATVSILEVNKREYLQSLKKNYLIETFFSDSKLDYNQVIRGNSLGYKIDTLNQAMVIDIFEFNSLINNTSESKVLDLKKMLYNLVVSNITYDENTFIIFEYSDKIILLFSNSSQSCDFSKNLKKFGNYLVDMLNKELDFQVSIGIGLYHKNYKDISNSIKEAITSIKISNKLFDIPQCSYYENIEIYDILLKNIDKNKAIEKANKTYENLFNYDNKFKTELYKTIVCLLKNLNNTQHAAETLFVHKNTILQRKKKIIQLLKEDPFEENNYMKYLLAMLILNTLESR